MFVCNVFLNAEWSHRNKSSFFLIYHSIISLIVKKIIEFTLKKEKKTKVEEMFIHQNLQTE